MYRGRIKNIHFVGIGGSGMSGIAEVLLNMGYKVTGSDLSASGTTERLGALGAVIYMGHDAANVADADCVVYSSAVKETNPELTEAKRLGAPIIGRAEMLAELMRLKYAVAVAGTHGKTTTTSIIAAVLGQSGMDPTVVTGGKLNSIGAGGRLGSGEFLIAEADESDGSFLRLTPTIAVVTGIDREHMDHYDSMEELKSAFVDFMNKVPFYGCAVVCLDHPTIQELVPRVTRRLITYGLSAQADVHATDIVYTGGSDGGVTSFEVWVGSERVGRATVPLPGEYNVYNSLAAIAVAMELEVGFDEIAAGLKGFSGVERRFQSRGGGGGVVVFDDYGLHPVEIRAALKAAKEGWSRRVVAVFQPHRYTRTRDLFKDFLSAFNDADRLFITDVFAAGEEPIDGVSSKALYESLKEHGHKDVTYVASLDEVASILDGEVVSGDMVITLGAGDVWKAGVALVDILKKRKGAEGLRIVGEGEDGKP